MLWSFLVWARAIHIKRILINHEISRHARPRLCSLSSHSDSHSVTHSHPVTRRRRRASAVGVFTFLPFKIRHSFFGGISIFYLQRKKVA